MDYHAWLKKQNKKPNPDYFSSPRFVLKELFFMLATNGRNTNSQKVKQQMKFIGLSSWKSNLSSGTGRSRSSVTALRSSSLLSLWLFFFFLFFPMEWHFLCVPRCCWHHQITQHQESFLQHVCPYTFSRKCTKDGVVWLYHTGETLDIQRMGLCGWLVSYCVKYCVLERSEGKFYG